MDGRTVILVGPDIHNLEAWTSITKLCQARGWNYRTVHARKLPIYYKGNYLQRIKLQ